MKIKNIIRVAFIALPFAAISGSFCSCSEEETFFPDYEKDWFQLEDNASDPVAHAAYEFYKKHNIPVFINDTIGTQQRVDVFGKEYTYYKTLALNANLGGGQSSYGDAFHNTFNYADPSVVPGALNYLSTQLMPQIPSFLHIHSILLVEGISNYNDEVYVGMNTLVITKASQLASYTPEQTKKLRAVILRAYIGKKLTGYQKYKEGLERFYNVSRALWEAQDIYNKSTWYVNSNNIPSCPFSPYDWNVTNTQKAQWAGFIDAGSQWKNMTPSTQEDVNMFAEAYFTFTDEEFRTTYAEHPLIIEKWDIIKPMLDECMK